MAKQQDAIVIQTVESQKVTIQIVGKSGLYCHRMSAKAKNQLMLGGRKKSAAERVELKHDPLAEFIDSMHVRPGMFEGTDIVFPAMALKSAMATAALVVAGIRKTDVQRLVYIRDEFVPVYGVPRVRMDITRSADINKTPDVRTRAYFSKWATQITVEFIRPVLSYTAIMALLYNAGVVCGIGDFRQEKGKGSYGTFEPTTSIPAALMDHAAQRVALADPEPDNEETRELIEVYQDAAAARA